MPTKISGTRLVYFSVPKNACTSIKSAILAHNDPEMMSKINAFKSSNIPWRQRPPAAVLPNGNPVRYVHDFYPTVLFQRRFVLTLWRYNWFCVVRDPVKRFLSAYANRIEHHDDLKRTTPATLDAAGLARNPDLECFVDRLDQYCAINRLIRDHFRPAVDFLGTRPGRFDRVFTMADLTQIGAYCGEAGAPITLPHMQTGGRKLKPDVLSEPMKAKLKAFYADDYRHWGGYF